MGVETVPETEPETESEPEPEPEPESEPEPEPESETEIKSASESKPNETNLNMTMFQRLFDTQHQCIVGGAVLNSEETYNLLQKMLKTVFILYFVFSIQLHQNKPLPISCVCCTTRRKKETSKQANEQTQQLQQSRIEMFFFCEWKQR